MRAKTGAINLLKGRDTRRNNYSLIVEMLLRHEQLEISDISGGAQPEQDHGCQADQCAG